MQYSRVEQLARYWRDHYVRKANELVGRFPHVDVNMSYRKSKTAGLAHVGKMRQFGIHQITLNIPLFAYNNSEYEIQTTTGHEIAHLVAYKHYNDRGHGRAWKWVMVQFGLEPNRCHSMNEAAATVGKNTTVYVHQCDGCGEHVTLGPKRHHRQMQAVDRDQKALGYRHRCKHKSTRSNGTLSFITQTDKRTFAKFINGDIDRLPVGRQDRKQSTRMVDNIPPSKRPAAVRNDAAAHRRDGMDHRKGPSKLDIARTIYRKMAVDGGRSRKEVITAIVNQASCTQAGAATYYAKIKKEYSNG